MPENTWISFDQAGVNLAKPGNREELFLTILWVVRIFPFLPEVGPGR
jgi:hypothetical protein